MSTWRQHAPWASLIVACIFVNGWLYKLNAHGQAHMTIDVAGRQPQAGSQLLANGTVQLWPVQPTDKPPSPPAEGERRGYATPTPLIPDKVGDEPPVSLVGLQAALAQLRPRCKLVVVTAVFDGVHLLQQPRYCTDRMAQAARRRAQRASATHAAPLCHIAFVDWQSERLLKQKQQAELEREEGEAFVGCWQLLAVAGGLPYVHAEANTLAAKLALPFLLPASEASIWVDASRQLRADEADAVHAAVAGLRPGAALGVRHEGDESIDPSMLIWLHTAGARVLAAAWWLRWEKEAATVEVGSVEAAHGAEAARTCAAALGSLLDDRTDTVRGSARARPATLAAAVDVRDAASLLHTSPASKARKALAVVSEGARLQIQLTRRRVPVRVADASPTALARLHVHFASAAHGGGVGFGVLSDGARAQVLGWEPSRLASLPCGFLTSSAYDAAAAIGLATSCELVTLTAIFDGSVLPRTHAHARAHEHAHARARGDAFVRISVTHSHACAPQVRRARAADRRGAPPHDGRRAQLLLCLRRRPLARALASGDSSAGLCHDWPGQQWRWPQARPDGRRRAWRGRCGSRRADDAHDYWRLAPGAAR